jgi:hypothetical protein
MNTIYAALATLILGFGGGFYLGGLKGTAKADTAKTAQEAQGEAIAQTDVTALEGQAAHAAAQQINDSKAETAHAQDDHTIDTTAPDRDPLFVQSGPAAKGVCVPAVPGAKAQASALGAGTAAGGLKQSGGDGVDRRPEIEALKAKLERIAADERLLIAEWPK